VQAHEDISDVHYLRPDQLVILLHPCQSKAWSPRVECFNWIHPKYAWYVYVSLLLW